MCDYSGSIQKESRLPNVAHTSRAKRDSVDFYTLFGEAFFNTRSTHRRYTAAMVTVHLAAKSNCQLPHVDYQRPVDRGDSRCTPNTGRIRPLFSRQRLEERWLTQCGKTVYSLEPGASGVADTTRRK